MNNWKRITYKEDLPHIITRLKSVERDDFDDSELRKKIALNLFS